MALLSFPTSPTNGQLYPPAPLIGQNQYAWDSANVTWRLLGTATGVTAGTYGDPSNIPIITVNAVGNITSATQVTLSGFLRTNNSSAYNTYVWPNTAGSTGQVLTTDGSGGLSWSPNATATGTVTSVQTGVGLSGGPIVTTGTISVIPATLGAIGGVKPDGVTTTVSSNGTLTALPTGVTSVTAGTGLTGGTITGTGTLALATTTVTAGTYSNASLTVDAYGRVTYAASAPGANGTFTSQDGKTVTVANGIITSIA